jgi:protein tyrosine/serine phosphatase
MAGVEHEANARRLTWDACRNVRDLGGLPTSDGGTTAWGALVRADNLGRLTAAGRTALLEHGVRTVIDIRFPDEIAAEPHPFQTPPAPSGAVTYLNIPVNSGRNLTQEVDASAAFAATRTREEANRLEVDTNPVGFARIVAAFAGAPTGGVVIHCHAGKDRTGIAVALLLALTGVPDQAIAADYALSLESIRTDASDKAPRPGAASWWAQPHHYRDCDPEAMLATLGHLRTRHDGAEAYLLRGGATAADLAAAKRRLRGQPAARR